MITQWRLGIVSGTPPIAAEPAQRVQATSCAINSTLQQVLVLPGGAQGDGTLEEGSEMQQQEQEQELEAERYRSLRRRAARGGPNAEGALRHSTLASTGESGSDAGDIT